MRRLSLHRSEVWLLLFVFCVFATVCLATGCGGTYVKPGAQGINIYAAFRPDTRRAA